MKKLLPLSLILVSFAIAVSSNAQTLFTYGKYSVDKDEFLKAYNKNNNNPELTEKAVREYLDLYIPFRLKVQAANEMRLDTLASQKAELQSFRNQVMQSFLTDAASLSQLVNEAFERSQQDIRISHIFIAAPADSAQKEKFASQQVAEAIKQLNEGKKFEDVALAFSTDPSVKSNKGDLGYITVFSLPYELETLAYGTPLNKFSQPYRSRAGYHIFKRTGERPAVGKIKIAQILLAFPPDATEADKKALARKADSLHAELLKGADFGKMAMDHSNDNFSLLQGGVLPEFGTGRFDAAFENAAFALKNDNEISRPLLSEFGYHIIKRLSVIPVVTDKADRENRAQLEARVQGDERMEISRKAFNKKILETIRYKKGSYDLQQLWAYTDSTLLNKPVPAKTSITPVTVLFSFAKQQVTVNDWLAFRRQVGGVDRITAGKTNQELLDYYLELAASEYYRNHLEEYNAEFAYQLKEFRDGNLLFEVMQRNVWDKASADESALRKYYSSNKNKYWWEENSASAIVFTAMHDSLTKDIRAKLQNNINNWRQVIESYEGKVLGDSGRFELSQLPGVPTATAKAGTFTTPSKSETDESVTFAYIIKIFPQKEQRSFEDARGYVINDYQQFLETAWLAELRKKYPVRVNEATLKSIVKR